MFQATKLRSYEIHDASGASPENCDRSPGAKNMKQQENDDESLTELLAERVRVHLFSSPRVSAESK